MSKEKQEQWSETFVEKVTAKWFWGLVVICSLYCLAVIAFIL